MSSPFRGKWEPQLTRLRPDIVLIEHSDPGAEALHISTNTYALLKAGRMLLVDVSVSPLLPFVRKLADAGSSPAAVVILHRHVIGLADALDELKTEFSIPFLLHPTDAKHRQALASGLRFENPIGHRILSEFDFEAMPFPGQTAGSIMLYSTNNGGVLLAGDSASGTSIDQAEAGLERLVRPPVQTSEDDAELRRQWLAFDRPVATVLPYHGTGYVGRSAADMASIMRPLTRAEPTYWNDFQG
jgi:glyoxylase-like metal-dependent hydrolase (beta-lactamase superfamily II)